MFVIVQAHEYHKYSALLDQMFRLRKKVFADSLGWNVRVTGDTERDAYDDMDPVYLVWCNARRTRLYGSMRLMPTTGPTLLYDVFRNTFPDAAELSAPGIWEGTRMCVDGEALAADFPELNPGRAFCLMLVALCEVALDHGIHTMISNYEPHMRRFYKRTGAEIQEIGRADGFGRHPVCCGSFEVSNRILSSMRNAMQLVAPLYVRNLPAFAAVTTVAELAA